jgi:hypothetical protein
VEQLYSSGLTQKEIQLKLMESLPRKEVRREVPEAVEFINSILQDAPKEDAILETSFLFHVSKVVERHPCLRAEIMKSPCKEVLVSILESASQNEDVYTRSTCMEYMCLAQSNLRIVCEHFWQKLRKMPPWYGVYNETIACIEHHNGPATCSIVYAYTKLREARAFPKYSQPFIELQHLIVHVHWDRFGGEEVSTVALCLSKQGVLQCLTLDCLQSASLRTAASMNAQSVVDTLWAFANASEGLGVAREAMLHAVLRVSGSMNPQNVGRTLWACAKMNLDLGKAEEAMMQAVVRVSDRMNGQSVGYTLWACAKMSLDLGEARKPLLRAVARVSASKNAQAVANMLWACAKLNFGSEQAKKMLIRSVPKVSRKMTADDVVNTLWAFASMTSGLGEAKEPMMSAILRVWNRLDCQKVACILWAFAKMNERLERTEEDLMIIIGWQTINPQEVPTMLWALSRLEIQPSMHAREHACLLKQIPSIASELGAEELQQVRCGIEWLQKKGFSDESMDIALHSLNARIG